MARLLYENKAERLFSLLFDLIVFCKNSVIYILEAIYLSLLPDKYRKEKDVSGQIVLITGGGGGVGRYVALNFAKLGARVVIWDINQEAIKTTQDLLETEGLTCRGEVVDISNREEVYTKAKEIKEQLGNVDILINNAGVVCCKPFWELPERVIENTYAINVISHYWTVKAFLPEMMERNSGHIVTVGSVAGLIGTYGCSDYSATKFACQGFHESLFTDLRSHGYDNIQLTLVCPYYINTGMFSGVRPRLAPMLEPKFVADRLTTSVRRNEVNCIIPDSVRMLLPLKCWLPAKMCWDLMHRVMKGPASMMLFEGRGKVPAG